MSQAFLLFMLALAVACIGSSTAISIDDHGAIAGESGIEAASANSLAIGKFWWEKVGAFGVGVARFASIVPVNFHSSPGRRKKYSALL